MRFYIPNDRFLFIWDMPEREFRDFHDWSWEYNIIISKRDDVGVLSRDGCYIRLKALITIDHEMLFLGTSMSGHTYDVALMLPEDKIYTPEEANTWLMQHGAKISVDHPCNLEQLLHALARGKGWKV